MQKCANQNLTPSVICILSKEKYFFMSTEILQGNLRLLALETRAGNVSAC